MLELLAAYVPPTEKRQSVMNRAAPEAFWVPARAILGRREQDRLQACAPRHKARFESAATEDDGIILHLLRHPRAADSEAHLSFCVSKLQEALGPEAADGEAERRLRNDEKFVLFLSQVPLLERDSQEDAAAGRSLRARAHILADAHQLGQTVQARWEEVQLAMEKVKWYRQLLGKRLAASDEASSSEAPELQACLDAMAKAWPNLGEVVCPKQQGKKRGAEGSYSGRQAKRAKGKGKS